MIDMLRFINISIPDTVILPFKPGLRVCSFPPFSILSSFQFSLFLSPILNFEEFDEKKLERKERR